MKQVKILYKDTKCMFCGDETNKRRANDTGWTQLIEIDFSGMTRGEAGYCCHRKVCQSKMNNLVQETARDLES